MVHVSITVNGRHVSAEIDPRTLLVQFLRENLRLTDACGLRHLAMRSLRRSCRRRGDQVVHDPRRQLQGASVTTIEGLAQGKQLHPMQQAFQDNHGLQCGFCTPGMIMTSVAMVNRLGHDLDEATIRHELEGNICRCTGYHNIVKSVAQGAREMGAAATPKAAE